MCVGVVTGIFSPFFGPLLMVRSGNEARAWAVTSSHRAEQRDEGGDVVDADVEERARAGLEEEERVRVPVLHAVAEHGGAEGDRLADEALVQQLAHRLEAAAEEGVGRGADVEALLLRDLEHRLRVVEVDRERLLVVDGLAGLQRHHADLGVGGGDGEVHDELDVRVGHQLLDGEGLDAELVGAGLGAVGEHVGDADDGGVVEGGAEVLAVDLGDDAGADDADPDRFACCAGHLDVPFPYGAHGHGTDPTTGRPVPVMMAVFAGGGNVGRTRLSFPRRLSSF